MVILTGCLNYISSLVPAVSFSLSLRRNPTLSPGRWFSPNARTASYLTWTNKFAGGSTQPTSPGMLRDR
ncbi:MAG: hypothetical protein M1281_01610 [Chloroflexi bacterium]|nr:hypothetical protein [Chloroflexota bacterium]